MSFPLFRELSNGITSPVRQLFPSTYGSRGTALVLSAILVPSEDTPPSVAGRWPRPRIRVEEVRHVSAMPVPC